MQNRELDPLVTRVKRDHIFNKGGEIVVILLEKLDSLDLPHLFHLYIVEIVSLSRLQASLATVFRVEVALENHYVKFTVLSSRNFREKLHTTNLLVLDHHHSAHRRHSKRFGLDSWQKGIRPDFAQILVALLLFRR